MTLPGSATPDTTVLASLESTLSSRSGAEIRGFLAEALRQTPNAVLCAHDLFPRAPLEGKIDGTARALILLAAVGARTLSCAQVMTNRIHGATTKSHCTGDWVLDVSSEPLDILMPGAAMAPAREALDSLDPDDRRSTLGALAELTPRTLYVRSNFGSGIAPKVDGKGAEISPIGQACLFLANSLDGHVAAGEELDIVFDAVLPDTDPAPEARRWTVKVTRETLGTRGSA